MENKQENIILNLSFDFAIAIVEFTDALQELKKYQLSQQLFRSGTSIGASIREAQSPESKADFIHKMKIADKETRETEFRLMICEKSKSYPNPSANLFEQLTSLKKLLSKIIASSKKINKKI